MMCVGKSIADRLRAQSGQQKVVVHVNGRGYNMNEVNMSLRYLRIGGWELRYADGALVGSSLSNADFHLEIDGRSVYGTKPDFGTDAGYFPQLGD